MRSRHQALALVMALIAALPACRSSSRAKNDPRPLDPSSRAPSVDPEQSWPYIPVSIRVHPLSRIMHDLEGDATVLEARIEFVDRDGDTTKAIGWLELAIAESPTARPAGSTWDCNLSDLKTNRLHYDVVTRTYLLKLGLQPGELPEHPSVVARLTTPSGQVLENRRVIRTNKLLNASHE